MSSAAMIEYIEIDTDNGFTIKVTVPDIVSDELRAQLKAFCLLIEDGTIDIEVASE